METTRNNVIDRANTQRARYLAQRKDGQADSGQISDGPTKFNEAQRLVLNVLSTLHTEEEVNDLRDTLLQFLSARMDREMARLEANGTVTPEKIASWRTEHNRTPYRS